LYPGDIFLRLASKAFRVHNGLVLVYLNSVSSMEAVHLNARQKFVDGILESVPKRGTDHYLACIAAIIVI
jgi:hypothetical protein